LYLLNCILPTISLLTVSRKLSPDGSLGLEQTFYVILSAFAWIMFWCLRLATLEDSGFAVFSWIAYVAHTFTVAVVRKQVREKYQIEANVVEDVFATLFLLPNVLSQMQAQMDEPFPKKDDDFVQGAPVVGVLTGAPVNEKSLEVELVDTHTL